MLLLLLKPPQPTVAPQPPTEEVHTLARLMRSADPNSGIWVPQNRSTAARRGY